MKLAGWRRWNLHPGATALCFAIAGCASSLHPDLRRLYDFGMQDAEVAPVIVIPGILGSRLRHAGTGEEIWPGSVYNLVFRPKDDLALKIDPQTLAPIADDVEAYDLFEGVLGNDYYGAILRTLRDSGGYVRAKAGEPAVRGQRRYYIFPYDWRQDNVVTARKLDALIEQIRRDYGNPQLKVDLVAHSMGGLVARYYLQYGTVDVLDGDEFLANFAGAAKLRTLVLLGTPNLGSVSALKSFLEGQPVGLSRVPTEVLATMPSIYELLPHPINDWLIDDQGQPVERDLFFAGTWLYYHWSVYDPAAAARLAQRIDDPSASAAYLETLQSYFKKRLERARRFVWSLSYNETQRAPVKLVVFGGDCKLTPARLLVDEADMPQEEAAEVRLYPRDVKHPRPGLDYSALMLEPGDGSVTKPSLLARQSLNPTVSRSEDVFFPLAYSFFLCEDHERLTGNLSFQDNLLNVLLDRERPWDGVGHALP